MTGPAHDIHKVHALTHVDISMALAAYLRAGADATLPPWLAELVELTDAVMEDETSSHDEQVKAFSDLLARAILHYITEA